MTLGISGGTGAIKFKWPNDVYCGGGKLAGIKSLVETDARG